MVNKKVTKLDLVNFQQLWNKYSIMASGATLVRQEDFPTDIQSIGINPRDSTNNDYWGTIITKPNEDKLVFGFTYFDKKENKENEDIYLLDSTNKLIEYYPKGAYEKVNPNYKGTHKGSKKFLKP